MNEKQINFVVVTALLALAPLAWWQYRWIGEVAEADEQRRKSELRVTLERIAMETDRDATELHSRLTGPVDGPEVPLEWRVRELTEREELLPVRRVVVVRLGADETWRAEAWEGAARGAKPVDVPGWWERRPFRAGPIQADPPALVSPSFDRRGGAPGWVIAELEGEAMAAGYFSRLLRRNLSEEALGEYMFRVSTRTGDRTVYTTSDEAMGGEPEGMIGLVRQIHRGNGRPEGGPPPRPGLGPRGKKRGPPPPPMGLPGEGIWKLEARHRGGSLEHAVARTKVRNLAVSGATLLVLSFALVALGIAVRRARRLARLQLEFTAGVSHELRTPLAVIVSAGDNLAGGYVKDPAKVREYGALVRDEGTRLTGMVDEVLRFSALDAEQMPMEKRALLVSDLMAGVEREMRPVAERQGCEWEARYENASLTADAGALHVAVRNLVENALRHGGGKWVGVRAEKAGEQIVVTVEDRGRGITAADMPHLFEPFYRGGESRAQQRKGSGLGLSLVDRIARAHGGSIRAANRAEGGARFTLTIPCG